MTDNKQILSNFNCEELDIEKLKEIEGGRFAYDLARYVKAGLMAAFGGPGYNHAVYHIAATSQ